MEPTSCNIETVDFDDYETASERKSDFKGEINFSSSRVYRNFLRTLREHRLSLPSKPLDTGPAHRLRSRSLKRPSSILQENEESYASFTALSSLLLVRSAGHPRLVDLPRMPIYILSLIGFRPLINHRHSSYFSLSNSTQGESLAIFIRLSFLAFKYIAVISHES